MASDRKQIARDSYAAFAAGDRSFFEERLSDDFLFSAPPDPKLDRAWYGLGLTLIDASSFIFRAYHAIQSDMRAPDGFPTRCLYGFSRMLLALVREAILACEDADDAGRRASLPVRVAAAIPRALRFQVGTR